MAECTYCKAETQLYDRDVPICTRCAEAREGSPRKPPTAERNIRASLLQELLETTARTAQAAREFEAVLSQFPSGLPHPDGTQRIKSASQNLTNAREALRKAHNRLSDYQDRGVEWTPSCSARSMVVLIGFIIAGVLIVGVVAAFLLYVSVLSIFTAVAIITGLVGTLAFGYWAGCRGRELTQGVVGPALNSRRENKPGPLLVVEQEPRYQ